MSNTPDKQRRVDAVRKMLLEGKSAKEIRYETGWHRVYELIRMTCLQKEYVTAQEYRTLLENRRKVNP